MACDFSVAQDLARFGQAGPKHGSAPIGGATDFLPVVVGAERAMAASRAVRAVLGPQGPPDGDPHRRRAGAEGRSARSSPTPRSRPSGWSTSSPLRLRRAEDRRGARGGTRTDEARHRRPRRCSTPASRSCARRSCSPSPTAPPRRSRSCASPSSTPGTATRRTRVLAAGAEHDDRGPRRLRRVQRGRQGRPRGGLRAAAPAARRGRGLAGGLHDAIQPKAHRRG